MRGNLVQAARAHIAAAIDHADTLTDEVGVMNGANWEQQTYSRLFATLLALSAGKHAEPVELGYQIVNTTTCEYK